MLTAVQLGMFALQGLAYALIVRQEPALAQQVIRVVLVPVAVFVMVVEVWPSNVKRVLWCLQPNQLVRA